ncbi:Dam family site-specific DNA-(adenine-N6)-methyltransferase [Utexia brackfieldae]|uniref:DNA adenine methylase n=1 Tax=Utexia brackfieldae TaxID=3074108 RepID=UPI00370DDCF3
MRVEKSFLKWIGSKNRIIDQLLPYLPIGESHCTRLIEPFVGAGNVFINTNYQSYIIGDSNRDLMNVYVWLYDNLALLVNTAESLFNDNLDYYEVRHLFNNCQPFDRDSVEQAARFIWLMRHCFNGICRYNKSGKFNTPKGNYKKVYFPKQELINFSNKLNSHELLMLSVDFTETLGYADYGDVIYCDPPYLSASENDSFVGYTPGGFDFIGTIALRDCLIKAVRKGAIAIVSNSDNAITRDIFSDFERYTITAPRRVAANGNRQPAKELICVLTPDML